MSYAAWVWISNLIKSKLKSENPGFTGFDFQLLTSTVNINYKQNT